MFSWGYPDATPDQSPTVSVELTEDGDGCLMTFTVERVQEAHDDIRTGWLEAIDNLYNHVEPTR